MLLIQNPRYSYFFLFLLAGVLYVNTLSHGFVLDDEIVILKNRFVHQGSEGIPDILGHDTFSGYAAIGDDKSILQGGRYRPLSLIFFAFLYSWFGDNPLPFHLFNILLYCGTGLLLFHVLRIILKEIKSGDMIALVTTTLFLVHPVHTEVVANIKSADELLALIFGLLFLWQLFLFQDKKSWTHGICSALFFFLACLSKEGAIVFLVAGPLALWFFRMIPVKSLLINLLPAIVAALTYLVIRNQVLGDQLSGTMMQDPMNNPFLQWNGQAWVASSFGTKIATMHFVFSKYVGLMVFPYPLIHDYYPFHIPLQTLSNGGVWFGLLLFATILGYGLYALIKRKIEGFGWLLFLIGLLPVSNLLYPVGVFMAERFLYLPSLGFLFAVIVLVTKQITIDGHKWMVYSAFALAGFFSLLTIMRNKAWQSNESLVLTDVKYGRGSAKLQNSAGTILLNKALQQKDTAEQKKLLKEAYAHLQISNALHPTYYDASLAMGACAYYLKQFEDSVNAYRKIAERHPQDQNAKTGLRYALEAHGRDELFKRDTLSAVNALKQAWAIYPDTATAQLLADIFSANQQADSSALWQSRVRVAHK